ncbi:MAG: UbiA family prenyltransferase [Dokdonella sp.]|uniref:UbiA family prenyltransferase n=1 Tax=Dokdonella sp. TaxID=2291710 RepID=UPI003F7FF952
MCVDLDGTLVHTDLLHESVLALLRRKPLHLLLLPLWLLRGKAHLKREIARRVEVDVTRLPYDARVLALLDEAATRPRVLCSASDRAFVDAVAAHVGGFDAALGSDGDTNLGGARKAQALVARYGERGFDYVGDATADVAVWEHARRAIAANASPRVLARLRRSRTVDAVIERRDGAWRAAVRALRPHQWSKNLLVYVAAIAAHRVFEPDALYATTLAFVAFCLCASGAYVFNDLVDLDADRRHPRKRARPFAAGRLSIAAGLVAAPLLVFAGFALASLLPSRFAFVLGLYVATTFAYSLLLKRVVLVDVIVLAALYTLRIVAGAVAIPVDASGWFLAFAMCLFLSLALVKRYAEVHRVAASAQASVAGRGYRAAHLAWIGSFGAAAAGTSLLVLALYVDSTKSAALYRHPHWLWLLLPLLGAWLLRVWSLTRRGRMHDDPVVFALTDVPSLAVLAGFIATVAMAA